MFLQDSRKTAEKLSTFGQQMALNKDVVGPNLRIARERMHWTKQRAAIEIGITERQLTRWEKSEVLPRWENLSSAAEVYGVDPAELTRDGDEDARSAPTLSEQIRSLAEQQDRIESKLDAALEIFGQAEVLAAAIDARRQSLAEQDASEESPSGAA